jgi:hypothetical protein
MMPELEQIRMRLEMLTAERRLTITGLHSVRIVDHDMVDCLFDVEPPSDLLHFRFPLPKAVSRNEVSLFAARLAAPDDLEALTRH